MTKTLNLPRFSKEELQASLCKDSFYDFVKTFWDTVIPEAPVWNWHIEYICSELQRVAERVFKGLPKLYDLIINVPPGTTKSTICSVMFPAWCWTRMVSTRMICASYAHTLAMDLSRKCRDVVKSEKYKKLFPNIDLRDDQDSKAYFVNTQGGDRYSVGVNGSVIGFHAHFLIVDDPLAPDQALSDAEIKTANHWMRESLASRKIDKRLTVMILIMQRLHQDDPTGSRLESQESDPVRHICLPSDIVDNWDYEVDGPQVKPRYLEKFYKEGLLDPVRLPRPVLEKEESTIGRYAYAGQYHQRPAPRGGGMFHINQLKYLNEAPPRMKRWVRAWDKAATKDGGAFSVGVKIGEDFEGRIIIADVKRGQWDSSRREKNIHDTARQDGIGCHVVLEQEGGGGGKESAEATVRRLRGFVVRVIKVSATDGDKVQRADPLATQVNNGNVYLVRGPWNDVYVKEMEYFPVSKYKDQIDASSTGFNDLAREPIRVGGLW